MRNARKHFPKYQSQILQVTSKILHGNKAGFKVARRS